MSDEPTPKQLREELLRQTYLAGRRRVMALPAQPPAPPGPQPAVAAQQAMAPLATILPVAARMATADDRKYTENPKIQAADLETYNRKGFDTNKWEGDLREVAKLRVPGEPSERMILAVGRELASQSRRHAPGMVQMSHALLAGCARCSKESVRKVVRFLEQHDATDTLNVLRDGLRGANAYILRLPGPPATSPPADTSPDAPAAELAPLARRNAALARCAQFFRLVVRPWGLNRTPLASPYLRSERTPAPA